MARVAADAVLLVHFGFILFVLFGGLLVWSWRPLMWVHLPAMAWGALIEFGGWVCPLTPLENRLRAVAGAGGYRGGFLEHYLIPVIYPTGLTRELQLVLGALVLAVNLGIYAALWIRLRKHP